MIITKYIAVWLVSWLVWAVIFSFTAVHIKSTETWYFNQKIHRARKNVMIVMIFETVILAAIYLWNF